MHRFAREIFFFFLYSMCVSTKILTQEKQRGNSPAQEIPSIHDNCWCRQRAERGICQWPQRQHAISSVPMQRGCYYSRNRITPPPRDDVTAKTMKPAYFYNSKKMHISIGIAFCTSISKTGTLTAKAKIKPLQHNCCKEIQGEATWTH